MFYWLLGFLAIYVIAGLYDERVFTYSVLGCICIFALCTLTIDYIVTKLCCKLQVDKTTSKTTGKNTNKSAKVQSLKSSVMQMYNLFE